MTKYLVLPKVNESSGAVSVHYPEDYISGFPDNHKDFRAGEVFDYPGNLDGWITSGLVEIYDGKPIPYRFGKPKKYRSIDDPGQYGY